MEIATPKRYTTITSISLTDAEMKTLDEIHKLENLPRKSRSGVIAFLIHFYTSKRLGEFDPLPPAKAREEAARLQKAATWYITQADADEAEAKREVEKKLNEVKPI